MRFTGPVSSEWGQMVPGSGPGAGAGHPCEALIQKGSSADVLTEPSSKPGSASSSPSGLRGDKAWPRSTGSGTGNSASDQLHGRQWASTCLSQMNLSMKQKQNHHIENRLVVAKVEGAGGGMDAVGGWGEQM